MQLKMGQTSESQAFHFLPFPCFVSLYAFLSSLFLLPRKSARRVELLSLACLQTWQALIWTQPSRSISTLAHSTVERARESARNSEAFKLCKLDPSKSKSMLN